MVSHKLFVDNLFISVPLLRQLKLFDIYVVGTVRLNRVPNIQNKLVPGKLLTRGSCSVATSSDNMTVVRWMDTKEVHMLSSYAGAEPEDEAKRWDRKKKEIIGVSRPFAVTIYYNKYMGGVDLIDRMIAHYPHGFKNKKWYLRLFFHFVNMSLVNSWLCYREKVGNMPLLTFKAAVATTLIQIGTSLQNKRGRPSCEEGPVKKKRAPSKKAASQVKFDGLEHYPQKVETKQAPRCHDRQCRRRTRYICSKCREPVCPECMKNFHTKST